MAYQQITWGNLKTYALNRLGGAGFYSDTEVGLYLAEAMRLWNLLTGYWKTSAELTTTASTFLYQTTLLVDASGDSALTDQNVLDEIQYHLLETPNSGASLDSNIWTIAEMTAAMNFRLSQFIQQTKLVLNRNTFSTTPGVNRYDLATAINGRVLDLHRVAWLDTDTGNSYGLLPADRYQWDSLRHSHATGISIGDFPAAYITTSTESTLNLYVVPSPPDEGTMDVIHTSTQATALSNTGVKFQLPDMFVHYIKWGTLADLLSKEGEANDPLRAQYCEMRFQEGILLARALLHDNMHMRVQYGNRILARESLKGLDMGLPRWQATDGDPKFWAPVGASQVILAVPPDTSSIPFNVEGLTNPTIPATDGAYPDIDYGNAQLLVDYAHHIALFKNGGEEWVTTMGIVQRFYQLAAREAIRRSLKGAYRSYLGRDLDTEISKVNAPTPLETSGTQS